MTDDLQERAREVLAETIGVKPEALNYAFLIPHDDALRAMLAFASPTPEPSGADFPAWLKTYVGEQDATTMRFTVAELEIAFNASRSASS